MIKNNEFNPVLEIKELKTYFFLDTGTVKAVDGINLTINRGKTLGIIGESGCGKSVTAHSILKLIPSPPGKIISGKITLYENDKVTEISNLKNSDKTLRDIRGRSIGMIFWELMGKLFLSQASFIRSYKLPYFQKSFLNMKTNF